MQITVDDKPGYRVTLDLHGWGDLQVELNRLTKQGRWDELPGLIDDATFEALVVEGAPGDMGRLVAARYGGTVDRVGLSMPYPARPETLAAIVAGFHPTPRG